MSRGAAFDVVRQFEDALAAYTGAPHVVTCDSCTNAIFLALLCWKALIGSVSRVFLPRRTYVGVAQAARNAGLEITWLDADWRGLYQIGPIDVWDSAKRFTADMWRPGEYVGRMVCVSFQAGKILPIGRGGAILTDSAEAVAWLRRARFDGRTPGDDAAPIQTPGWHMYLTPPDAARGLWLLSWAAKDNPDLPNGEYDDLSTMEAFR